MNDGGEHMAENYSYAPLYCHFPTAETPIEAMKRGQRLNLVPAFPPSPCLALDLFAPILQIQFHWLKQNCLPALNLATTGLIQGMKWSLLKAAQPMDPILLLLFVQRGGEWSFRAG